MLVHSVYGGMLTTQLGSFPVHPFESLEMGLESYPDWKLCILKGNEDVIYLKAKEGPIVYENYWNYIKTKPEEHICANIKEGVQCLINRPGCFLYTTRFKVEQYVSFNYLTIEIILSISIFKNPFLYIF